MSLVLLDSNIVIYSFDKRDAVSADYVAGNQVCCSIISRIEVLGAPQLHPAVESLLLQFFDEVPVYDLDEATVDVAVALRKQRRIKLGDSIIAATALVNSLPLVTRNSVDFAWIDGLTLINPYSQENP